MSEAMEATKTEDAARSSSSSTPRGSEETGSSGKAATVAAPGDAENSAGEAEATASDGAGSAAEGSDTPEAPPAAEASGESSGGETAAKDEEFSERARRQRATMEVIRRARESEEPVEGQVIGWNKGGYHVAVDEIAAFCPVSQIEIGNPRSPKRYMDRTFPFMVIDVEEDGRRVVLSRAEALKAERERRLAKVREKVKPGKVFEGKVSSLTDFGAFVDVGDGIEGLVHVSEISRTRVRHPKERLRRGQQVKVAVLKVEEEGERISLSMKELEPDPWEGAAERYPVGSKFTGKVLRKADFGLFVEVEPGLEGLVHLSRLPHGVDLDDDGLAPGNQVEGWIHGCSEKRRRLSLSLREVASEDPWKGASDRYPVGKKVQGTVERIAPFGAFVELEPGLTALLPFSQVDTPPGSDAKRLFQTGTEVSAQVLSVDPRRKRMSLGSKSVAAEGTRADLREYQKQQQQSRGLNTLAAAFEKLKSEQQQGG